MYIHIWNISFAWAQIGSGPCKGYVSYMYAHIILYDRRWSDVILYHPMHSLYSDPILFSRVTPYFFPRVTPYFLHWGTPYFFSGGNPQVTAHGHFPTLSLGGTSSHTWEGGLGGDVAGYARLHHLCTCMCSLREVVLHGLCWVRKAQCCGLFKGCRPAAELQNLRNLI